MLPALFLILAAIIFRVLPPLLHLQHHWLQNFSPLAAIVLCGALFFPKRFALWVPLLILAISDVILNVFAYHFPLVTWEITQRYVVFLIIGGAAFLIRDKIRGKNLVVLSASVVGSLLFYLVTNTAGWFSDAGYLKSFAGWLQAMTTGLPGYPPTWTFFRNSLIGDFLFTGLFLISMSLTSKKRAVSTVSAVPNVLAH